MQALLDTTVIDMLRRLVSERDPKTFFEQAADEAARLVGADGAALIEVLDGGQMQYRFFRGLPADHQRMADGHRFAAARSTAGAALHDGLPIFTPNYPEHPNAMPAFVASGLKANLIVPCGPAGNGSAVLAIAWLSHYPKKAPDANALALIMLIADLMHAALYRQSLERDLERQAEHDALTGLPNRRYLTSYLIRLFGATPSRQPGGIVAVLDLDDFKPINDRFGHLAGDGVLKEVSMRLTAALGANELVARLGGDEFVLVLPPQKDATAIETIMERIRIELDRPYRIASGHWVVCSSSIGVAIDRNGTDTPERLMTQADQALYVAKRHKVPGVSRWEIDLP